MNDLRKKIAGIEKLLSPDQVSEILGIKVETLSLIGATKNATTLIFVE